MSVCACVWGGIEELAMCGTAWGRAGRDAVRVMCGADIYIYACVCSCVECVGAGDCGQYVGADCVGRVCGLRGADYYGKKS